MEKAIPKNGMTLQKICLGLFSVGFAELGLLHAFVSQ